MINVDFHLHTCHSYDCATTLADFSRAVRTAGLDCVAVTDHNTIDGALRLRDSGEIRVIVGQEVGTREGELIGLFLEKVIPAGLSAEESIGRIKDQGGLVCIPHPFGRRRFKAEWEVGHCEDGQVRLSNQVRRASRLLTEEGLERIDMLEAVNSRTRFRGTWDAVGRLAQLYGLPLTAGSDAHTVREIGRSRVEMPDFCNTQSFINSLREGRLTGTPSSIFIHFGSMYARLSKLRC